MLISDHDLSCGIEKMLAICSIAFLYSCPSGKATDNVYLCMSCLKQSLYAGHASYCVRFENIQWNPDET